MYFLKKNVKKLAGLMVTFSLLGIPSSPALAQDESKDASLTELLKYIANYTYYTLQAVNNLPTYMNTITTLTLSWLSPDNSDTTANLQNSFSKMSDQIIQDSETQLKLQQKLSKDYIGPNITPEVLPYANDLTYQTVLGHPYFNPNEDKKNQQQQQINIDPSIYNYIKNASGATLRHIIPDPNWKGTDENQVKYNNFYQTISAIQSYDSYILTRLYTDSTKDSQLTKQQRELVRQASSSDWFTQVASENLGIVLRQILLYNSQFYIVLTQILEVQKQQLAAQAMTNTLIVIGNQYNETNLLTKAIGR